MRLSSPRSVLRLEALEQRTTPVLFAVGSQAGADPEVKVLDLAGTVITSFLAYDPSFRGGVRVAMGDVNHDGFLDVVTAPGAGGGPQIKVFDGATHREVLSFFAFDPNFHGGASVAVGRIGGREVIAAGAGTGGGPVVSLFDAVTGVPLRSFFAFDPAFLGGVSVAIGDVSGDGRGAVVAAAGPGGGPVVSVFDGPTGRNVQSFFAYAPNFHGGVTVAVGDVLQLGRDQIVTGPGYGGGPQVNVFDAPSGAVVRSFFAYDPAFFGGVGVIAIPNGGGDHDLLATAPGPGGGPDIRVFDLAAGIVVGEPVPVYSFFAYPYSYSYGLSFGCGFGLWLPYFPSYLYGSTFVAYTLWCPVAVPFGYIDPGYDYWFAPDLVYVDQADYIDPSFVESTDPGTAFVPDTGSGDFGTSSDWYVDDGYYYDPGYGDYYSDWGGGFFDYGGWGGDDYWGGEF